MPRADRVTLTLAGLTMPTVDHLSNNGMLNVLLDRALAGASQALPSDRTMVGLFMNLARLTDKALREYDAARIELTSYADSYTGPGLRTSPYIRAIDHMENCVSATHRGVLNANVLFDNKIGRAAPRLTVRQEKRLAFLRNAVEHSDEKLQGKQFGNSAPFAKNDPFSLRLANTSMVIGANVLTYKELVSAITKCHRTIEIVRGVKTGVPGPSFPNARLRTELPQRKRVVSPTAGNVSYGPDGGVVITVPTAELQASDYLKELSRLVVTHT